MLTAEQTNKLTGLLDCEFKDLIILQELLYLIEKRFTHYNIAFIKGQYIMRIQDFQNDKTLTGISEISLEDAIFKALLKD